MHAMIARPGPATTIAMPARERIERAGFQNRADDVASFDGHGVRIVKYDGESRVGVLKSGIQALSFIVAPPENKLGGIRDSERLLMIANFLGELRSLRIPNYQNGGGSHPALMILFNAGVQEAADLPTEALKEAYAEAVKKNA